MMRRILITGTGGQGIIAAGEFLSEALFRAGYEVVNTRSYGAEARGGSSRSEVLVSDEEIYDLEIGEVDILVAMSMQAYGNNIGRAKKNALVFIETELMERLGEKDKRTDVNYVEVPANKVASALGNLIVANMVFLGPIAKITGLLTLKELEDAIKTSMRPAFHDINIKAINEGYSLA